MTFEDLSIGDWFTSTYYEDGKISLIDSTTTKAVFIKITNSNLNCICIRPTSNFCEGKEYHIDTWREVNFISCVNVGVKNLGFLKNIIVPDNFDAVYLKIYNKEEYVCIWSHTIALLGHIATDEDKTLKRDCEALFLKIFFPEEHEAKQPIIYSALFLDKIFKKNS